MWSAAKSLNRLHSLDRVIGWIPGPLVLLCLLTSCSSKPPADFAPDPALVDQIAEIRMTTGPFGVCPGQRIAASYVAVLEDGSHVPFATQYDDDNPPLLHVVFLGFRSAQASWRRDGSWDTDADPLVSAISGYRLTAFMRAKPTLTAVRTVSPEYSCLRHAFSFRGRHGGRGQAGTAGPDVTARVAIVGSPFYERLLVASIQAGEAPPFFVLANADVLPPADWVILETRGGNGGRGVPGTDGAPGANGPDGCPAGAGGAGGAGGNGGPGGPGGQGGRVTVIVPDESPLLAGMVDPYSKGGNGGEGGAPGTGGPGGEGGRGIGDNRRCANGVPGQAGSNGSAGPDGAPGAPGPRAQVLTVAMDGLFGRVVPPTLQDLIDYHERNR